METAVRGRVTTLLDACDGDEVVDVVSQLAIPFPLQVICSMLGLPDDDLDRLFAWSEAAIPGAGDYSDDERMTLLGEMTMFLLDLAASRRHAATPGGAGGDIVSTLAEVRIDGEQLRDDELAMFLIQLLVAGNETTRNALSGGLVALAQHPDELARLRADPSLIPSAVEEVLRWTTPVVSFMRTATCDTTLGGAAISAGDPVLLLYAAANRDADAFGPTAARFDVGRDPNHHVALGFGIHFCLGAALARLELRAALEEVLGRWAHLELAGDVVRSGSSVIAGVRRAPLRVSR
jgi:cytochrome P450